MIIGAFIHSENMGIVDSASIATIDSIEMKINVLPSFAFQEKKPENDIKVYKPCILLFVKVHHYR